MARKPMIVQEEVNISDWKKWVTWKSGNDAMRCQVPVSLGIIHPGLVVLLPSPSAKRYVVGHVGTWQTPPMDETAESKAVTTMELYVEGKTQGKFKVPNASVLCYVDFRIMQPPYAEAPVHPALLGAKKHDFAAYYQIIQKPEKK